VSPALPSLLSSSAIVVALELHRSLTSTTHPSPAPIGPDNLIDESHRRGRLSPRRGPAIPSTLWPNWPHHHNPLPPPVPCHHFVVTEPGPRQRTVVGPHRQSSPDRFAPFPVRPPNAVSLPLPMAHGPTPTAPSPRRSPAGGPSGPPTRAAARAFAGPNSPQST
jgi:hypothetical protein